MTLIEKFSAQDTLPDAVIQQLESLITHQIVPKSTVIQQAGKLCEKLYFVEQGLIRAYHFLDGKEVTDSFHPENTIATAVDSFMLGSASRSTFELLEECHLSILSFADIKQLMNTSHAFERVVRRLFERVVFIIAQELDSLKFLSADERYSLFIRNHPDLIARVPLGQIASYIGITQETLSRIRAKR